jgi:hypothetical protein
MAMTEQSQEFFAGFSPAMVIAYIHAEMGDDALREFLDLLENPTEKQRIEQCISMFGALIPHDLEVMRQQVIPWEEYAAELADMGLEHVAYTVRQFAKQNAPTTEHPQ